MLFANHTRTNAKSRLSLPGVITQIKTIRHLKVPVLIWEFSEQGKKLTQGSLCQNVSNIIICLLFFLLFLYYSQMEIHPSNIIRFLEEKILAFSNWKQLLFRKEDKNTISICTPKRKTLHCRNYTVQQSHGTKEKRCMLPFLCFLFPHSLLLLPQLSFAFEELQPTKRKTNPY